jgi:hypothetical protein
MEAGGGTYGELVAAAAKGLVLRCGTSIGKIPYRSAATLL